MGGLLGGGSAANSQITTYSGLQVQTTSACVPIPIVYGVNMLTPNVIWYNSFQRHQTSGKSGGKGGVLGGSSTPSYSYTCAIIMALCEGPISNIGQIWQNSSTQSTSLEALNAYFTTGYNPQQPWNYLTSNYPSEALSYNGVAYVSSSYFDLGPSAAVGNTMFELWAILSGTGFNGIDADPARVIQDYLTNAQYGVGFPAASIDTTALLGGTGTASYQAYCHAAGIAISPVLNQQEAANTTLGRWLQLTNSTAIWSGGKLKIIPYGDYEITANGVTWNPSLTPLYDLTDEDFIDGGGDDPVIITRSDPYSAYNNQSIEIMARSDNYNTGPITAFDQSMIDRFGLRVGPTITAHEITTLAIAQTVAQLILQRQVYIRRTYQFKLSWEFCALDPMDLVTLTDPVVGNKTVVRITDIEEGDDGNLTVTAEEFPQGVATGVVYDTQSRSNGVPDSTVAANPVNAPIIIEPPAGLTAGEVQIWIGTSGAQGDPNYGGCVVWVSSDDTSYAEVQTITGPATQGVLSAALPNYTGTNPDAADTLAVDLTESGTSLTSTTAPNAAAGATVCYVGGEYLSFTTATLTAANKYKLTGLYRGQYGVTPQAVPSGAPFLLLRAGSIAKFTVPVDNIGDTFYFKLQSFNIFGSGEQEIADVAAVTYTVTGEALAGPLAAPQNLSTVFASGFENLSWSEVVDARSGIRYKISKGTSPATAQVIGDVAHPPFTLVGAGTYYVTAYVQPAIGLTVTSPASAPLTIAGNMLIPNPLRTWDQQAENWAGTLVGLTKQGSSPTETLTLSPGQMAGTYTIPAADIIDLGYVGVLALNVTWQAAGEPVGQDVLAVTDFLSQIDVLGSSYAQYITCYPEIQIGIPGTTNPDVFADPDAFSPSDVFSPQPTWGSWQRFQPGNYQGRYANLRMQIATTNPQVGAILTAFSVQATVEARIDHYQNQTIPAAGLTITFKPDGTTTAAPFNGGPNSSNLPYVNVTYSNTAGDVLQITALSLTSMKVQILNGGTGVARSGVNIAVEGF